MVGTLLREGDLAIFFGDEGTGKSVFSYQIGDAISKGKDLIDIDGLRNQSKALVVAHTPKRDQDIWQEPSLYQITPLPYSEFLNL